MTSQAELFNQTEALLIELEKAANAADINIPPLNQNAPWEETGQYILDMIADGQSEFEQFEDVAELLIQAGEDWEG